MAFPIPKPLGASDQRWQDQPATAGVNVVETFSVLEKSSALSPIPVGIVIEQDREMARPRAPQAYGPNDVEEVHRRLQKDSERQRRQEKGAVRRRIFVGSVVVMLASGLFVASRVFGWWPMPLPLEATLPVFVGATSLALVSWMAIRQYGNA